MFISLCGLEGASKSTSMSTVRAVFESAGFNVVCVREPGGTTIAEAIRDIHKMSCDEVMHIETELLLMFAARHQLYQNVVAPALARPNTVVISDRSWWCTYAYQIHDLVSLETRQLFWELKRQFTDNLMHDAVLYLDVVPEIGMERARGRAALDRIEQKDITFFHRARRGYLELLDSQPHSTLLDTNADMDTVQAAVKAWAQSTAALHQQSAFSTF